MKNAQTKTAQRNRQKITPKIIQATCKNILK